MMSAIIIIFVMALLAGLAELKHTDLVSKFRLGVLYERGPTFLLNMPPIELMYWDYTCWTKKQFTKKYLA